MFNLHKLVLSVFFILCSAFWIEKAAVAQVNYCGSAPIKVCSRDYADACVITSEYQDFERKVDFYRHFDLPRSQVAKFERMLSELRNKVAEASSAADLCVQRNTLRCDAPNETVSFDRTTCVCVAGSQRNEFGTCEPVEVCHPIINLRPSEEVRRRNDGRFVSNSGQCFVEASCASGTLRTITSNLLVCEIGPEICDDTYQPVCAHRRIDCDFGKCYETARSFDNACLAREAKHFMILDGVCPTTNFCAAELVRNNDLNICVVPGNKVTQPPIDPAPINLPVTVPPETKVCDELFVYDESKGQCVPDKAEILRQVCRAKHLKWVKGQCR